MKSIIGMAVISVLLSAGAAAGDVKTSPVVSSQKSAGVQLWANGPYWAESNLGAAKPEDAGSFCNFSEAATAVTARLGPRWRMPTKSEFDALCNGDEKERCRWKWDPVRRGVVITGATAGYTDKSIFLPAAGCDYGDGIDFAGSCGRYWTSTRLGNERAWCLFFGPCYYYVNDNVNGNGLAVRAVRSAQ